MGNVANDRPTAAPELPAGRPPRRVAASGTLTWGLPVADVLGVSTLAGSRVLAGGQGLARLVTRLNVMEVPDILPWVKPHELLLTTGYPLRDTPQALAGLVTELDARGLAALAIKLGRYIDELPPEMLEQADRLGFPIIELPDGVGFDDILNQVLTGILNRQAAVLARSEEVHRTLVQIVLAGGGLQEVCDELARLLGGVVLVAGTDGRVVAAAGAPEDLDRARRSPAFDAEGRFLPGAAPDSLAVPIVAGKLDHGWIVAFAADAAAGERDVHTLERAATVAALVVTRELAVTAVESKYQADFLRDLLAGRAGGPERTVPHSAGLGWDIDRPLAALVVEPDAEASPNRRESLALHPAQDRLTAAWTSAVHRVDPRAPVVGFAREVVALVGPPATGSVADLARRLARDVRAAEGDRLGSFSVGTSRTVAAPTDLPAAYEQAREAVRVGRQVNGSGEVTAFDELGTYRLLSLVPDSAELRSFLDETLGPLAADEPEAADLRRTLEVLLECNLNVATAARRLHFHYNTLRYRIGKLERTVGPFTRDAHLRLDLALALRVLRMRGL